MSQLRFFAAPRGPASPGSRARTGPVRTAGAIRHWSSFHLLLLSPLLGDTWQVFRRTRTASLVFFLGAALLAAWQASAESLVAARLFDLARLTRRVVLAQLREPSKRARRGCGPPLGRIGCCRPEDSVRGPDRSGAPRQVICSVAMPPAGRPPCSGQNPGATPANAAARFRRIQALPGRGPKWPVRFEIRSGSRRAQKVREGS
jgi:hypothetical protein